MEAVARPCSFRTGYLDRAVEDLAAVIDRAKVLLAGVQFDTLVGTGLSGTIVVPSLALALGKTFVIVRKDNDGSHHNGKLVGQLGSSWIFVDDFVNSGDTRRRVLNVLADQAWLREHRATYVGDYLYAQWISEDDYGLFAPPDYSVAGY